MPEVSVVVPTRNRRGALLRLLSALARQSGVRIQPIVVVDGSTDGTLEALARCADPDLVVVDHRHPKGVSRARNAGLERADAEHVGFIDDDDLWSPTRIVDALEAMSSSPHDAGWSCCGAAYVDGDLRVTGLHAPPDPDAVTEQLYSGNKIPGGGSGVVARTELVRSAGGFAAEFADLADWDMWIRLAALSPLATVPRYQIAYMLDDRQRSYTRPARCYEELARLRAKHGFGSEGRADFDPGTWTRWMSGQHWRAHDRLGLSRRWLCLAVRSRQPLDLARGVGYLVLPRHMQRNAREAFLRRSLLGFSTVDIASVESWLAELAEGEIERAR